MGLNAALVSTLGSSGIEPELVQRCSNGLSIMQSLPSAAHPGWVPGARDGSAETMQIRRTREAAEESSTWTRKGGRLTLRKTEILILESWRRSRCAGTQTEGSPHGESSGSVKVAASSSSDIGVVEADGVGDGGDDDGVRS